MARPISLLLLTLSLVLVALGCKAPFQLLSTNTQPEKPTLARNSSNTPGIPSDVAATTTPASIQWPDGGCPQYADWMVVAYDDPTLDTLTDLYLLNPTDGNMNILGAPQPFRQSEPAWSPERCRVAFSGTTQDGNNDIYVISADGTQLTRLTSDPAKDMFPDWTPDGNQIVFTSFRWQDTRNLFVMNADGSDVRQLTFNGPEFSQWPQVSPLGGLVVYTQNAIGNPNPGGRLFLVGTEGIGNKQLTPEAANLGELDASWSSDGQTIFFLSNRSSKIEIWSIGVTGSDLKQITNLPAHITPSHCLRVSPDGKRIAFYGVGKGVEQNGQQIFVLNVDGTGLHEINESPGNEDWFDW